MKFICVGIVPTTYIFFNAAVNAGYEGVVCYLDEDSDLIPTLQKPIAIPVASYDIDELRQIAAEQNVRFVLSHPVSSDEQVITAQLNTSLASKGLSESVANSLSDKIASYEFVEALGFTAPKRITAPQTTDFPAIWKPRFGAGSQGVRQVWSLPTDSEDGFLCERLEGTLVGFNGFVSAGEMSLYNIWEVEPGFLPESETTFFPNPLQISRPELIDAPITEAVTDLIEKIGLDNCSFQLETKMVDKEFAGFIEINLRPGAVACEVFDQYLDRPISEIIALLPVREFNRSTSRSELMSRRYLVSWVPSLPSGVVAREVVFDYSDGLPTQFSLPLNKQIPDMSTLTGARDIRRVFGGRLAVTADTYTNARSRQLAIDEQVRLSIDSASPIVSSPTNGGSGDQKSLKKSIAQKNKAFTC